MTRIVLVRHGRSAHVHAGWIDVHSFHRWREAYEAAGIAHGENPPHELRAIAARAGVIAASDAPRAIESARLLRPDAEIVTSPLLREMDLRAPAWQRWRLPLAGWAVVFAFRWLRKAASPEEEERARAAAEWLVDLARQHGDVVVVTHGWFRAVLARALKAKGWESAMRGARITGVRGSSRCVIPNREDGEESPAACERRASRNGILRRLRGSG